jgi:hypothetical protein
VSSQKAAWLANRKKRETFRAVIVFALFLVSAVILAGCASSEAQIQNVPLSFNAVKTVVVKNLPGGIVRESDNGRTMTSAYFDPESLKIENEKKPLKVHAFVTIVIFGTSRPYSVDVKAFKEEQRKDGYESLGEDPDLTNRLAERLRAALADRREDRNIIDDFRVF